MSRSPLATLALAAVTVVGAIPASVAALTFASGCEADKEPAKPTTANTHGFVYRDGKPLTFGRLWRSGPPIADGGSADRPASTDGIGAYSFDGISRPFSLRVFDALSASSPRTLYEVHGLGEEYDPGKDPLHPNDLDAWLRFGALEGVPGLWRAHVRVRLEDDPGVSSQRPLRTLVVASGSRFFELIAAPNDPTGVADLDLAWGGTFETFLRLHVLRFTRDAPLTYVGYGVLDVGKVHGGQTIEQRMELHPVLESSTVKVRKAAPANFVTHIAAALDFGEGSPPAVLDENFVGDAIDYPKLPGAHAILRGRAEHDGDASRVTVARALPLTGSEEKDGLELRFAEPVSLEGPADGATARSDARFAFRLPALDLGAANDAGTSAPKSWVHELDLSPIGADASDRVRYVVVTNATEATVPSGSDVAVPTQLPDAAFVSSSLPLPHGDYEWRVTSRPDLLQVDDWTKPRDERFERIVQTKPHRVTFAR